MPHPKSLIESIRQQIERSYPSSNGFFYEFETRLIESPMRVFPDITVRNRDKQIVCLVEIGYTRPEKLKEYRSRLGIADVRWYAKDGELITEWEQTIEIVKLEYQPDERETFYYVLMISDVVCDRCLTEIRSGLDPDLTLEEAIEEASEATYSHVWISDCNRGLAITFCDKCAGPAWIDYSGSDELRFMLSAEDLGNLDDFIRLNKRSRYEEVDVLLSIGKLPYQRPEIKHWPQLASGSEQIESFIAEHFGPLEIDFSRMAAMEW